MNNSNAPIPSVYPPRVTVHYPPVVTDSGEVREYSGYGVDFVKAGGIPWAKGDSQEEQKLASRILAQRRGEAPESVGAKLCKTGCFLSCAGLTGVTLMYKDQILNFIESTAKQAPDFWHRVISRVEVMTPSEIGLSALFVFIVINVVLFLVSAVYAGDALAQARRQPASQVTRV